MIELAVCLVSWLLAIIVSELALAGRKVQTGLRRALVVYVTVGAALVSLGAASGRIAPPVLVVFWCGAFLTWFCVRSHVESSILLRFLYLMRSGPMRKNELLDRYEAFYGRERRVEELLRAGLVEEHNGEQRVTRKGALILRIARLFR